MRKKTVSKFLPKVGVVMAIVVLYFGAVFSFNSAKEENITPQTVRSSLLRGGGESPQCETISMLPFISKGINK